MRTEAWFGSSLAILVGLGVVSACTANNASTATSACVDGIQNGDETGIDCGGHCAIACDPVTGNAPGVDAGTQVPHTNAEDAGPDAADAQAPARRDDGLHNGCETDVDCGGPAAPKCVVGKKCLDDTDCTVACNYAKRCIDAPSCAPHLGGDTCGKGEVGEPGAQHESCCRSLTVPGYIDPAHPGKTVTLDKYEITAGRMRAFVDQMARENGGNPNVKGWIAKHRPQIWDQAWEGVLPSDLEGGTQIIGRRLLGDPRPEDSGSNDPPGPGVILPPATDQLRHMGTNYQFGSEIYVDLPGNNCATYAGTYGFPTYYYPASILSRDGQLPRADGVTATGQPISAKDLLDVKSMNCVTNAMLAAFCAWDGGQLATDEVVDFVTQAPASLGNVSGCGTQIDDHGELLSNIFDHTIQTGGRCPPVALVNATFDAGDALPVAGSPLNVHNYHYPDTGNPTHDKAWQIAAPGRASLAAAANGQPADAIRINAGDEPWMDLHGNLSESVLDMSGATFTGTFGLKHRGIGYGSSRSDLNVTLIKGETIVRIQRPEAKAAFAGGRCMRFK